MRSLDEIKERRAEVEGRMKQRKKRARLYYFAAAAGIVLFILVMLMLTTGEKPEWQEQKYSALPVTLGFLFLFSGFAFVFLGTAASRKYQNLFIETQTLIDIIEMLSNPGGEQDLKREMERVFARTPKEPAEIARDKAFTWVIETEREKPGNDTDTRAEEDKKETEEESTEEEGSNLILDLRPREELDTGRIGHVKKARGLVKSIRNYRILKYFTTFLLIAGIIIFLVFIGNSFNKGLLNLYLSIFFVIFIYILLSMTSKFLWILMELESERDFHAVSARTLGEIIDALDGGRGSGEVYAETRRLASIHGERTAAPIGGEGPKPWELKPYYGLRRMYYEWLTTEGDRAENLTNTFEHGNEIRRKPEEIEKMAATALEMSKKFEARAKFTQSTILFVSVAGFFGPFILILSAGGFFSSGWFIAGWIILILYLLFKLSGKSAFYRGSASVNRIGFRVLNEIMEILEKPGGAGVIESEIANMKSVPPSEQEMPVREDFKNHDLNKQRAVSEQGIQFRYEALLWATRAGFGGAE